MDAGTALGVIAIVIAVIVPFIAERLKRRALDIEIVEEQSSSGIPYRHLHARVINRPHRVVKWAERNPAVDSRVVMTFYDSGGRKLFDPLEAKWDDGPQPLAPAVQLVANPAQLSISQSVVTLFNDAMIPFAHRIVIPPSIDGKSFAVVIKHQGQDECYAFNGWSYAFGSRWSNPAWQIGKGEFRVEMRVTSGSMSKLRSFVLKNDGPNLTDISLTDV